MLKIIYGAICVLNVLDLIELDYMLKRIIKEHNLHRIQKVSLIEKIIVIIKLLIFAFTPILHIALLLVGFRCLYTEEGKDDFFEKALENYE